MIHPDIQAMLVRERSATLLAAAAAHRRGRQARSAAATVGRAAANRTAPDRTAPDRTAPDRTAPGRTAPDRTAPGRTAPGRTAERGRVVLRDGSAVLIRRLRLLGRKRTLTEADLRFFTDNDHEALGHVRGTSSRAD